MIKVQSKTLRDIVLVVIATLMILTVIFLGEEAAAFSQPLVQKTNVIVQHGITIAQAVIGVGIIWFVFTLLMNRPSFKIIICTTFAGVIVGTFATFVGFLGGS